MASVPGPFTVGATVLYLAYIGNWRYTSSPAPAGIEEPLLKRGTLLYGNTGDDEVTIPQLGISSLERGLDDVIDQTQPDAGNKGMEFEANLEQNLRAIDSLPNQESFTADETEEMPRLTEEFGKRSSKCKNGYDIECHSAQGQTYTSPLGKVATIGEDWSNSFPWKAEEIIIPVACMDVLLVLLALCRLCYHRCLRRQSEEEKEVTEVRPQDVVRTLDFSVVEDDAGVAMQTEQVFPQDTANIPEDIVDEPVDELVLQEEVVEVAPTPEKDDAMSSSPSQLLQNLPTPVRHTGPRKAVPKSEEEVRQRMAKLRAQCEVLDESEQGFVTTDAKNSNTVRLEAEAVTDVDAGCESNSTSPTLERPVPKKAVTKSWAEVQGRMQELQGQCKVFSENEQGCVTTEQDLVSHSDSAGEPNSSLKWDTPGRRRSVLKTEQEIRDQMAERRGRCEVIGESSKNATLNPSSAVSARVCRAFPELAAQNEANLTDATEADVLATQDAKDAEKQAMQELEQVMAEAERQVASMPDASAVSEVANAPSDDAITS